MYGVGKGAARFGAYQTAEALLAKADSLGLRVRVDGDNILIRPFSKLTEDMRSRLRALKPEILILLRERERKRIEHVEMLLDYIDRLGGKWYPSSASNSFKHEGGGAPLARELLTNYPEETFSCVMAAKAIFWAKHGFPML